MAQPDTIRSSIDRTVLTGIPGDATDEQIRQAFVAAREAGYAGKEVAFSSVSSRQAPVQNTPTPGPIRPSDSTMLNAAEKQLASAPAPQSTIGPQTDAAGLTGAVVRGASPYLAAAGTGALIGSAVPGFGTGTGAAVGLASAAVTQMVAPAVTKVVNSILGTQFEDPREAARALFTQMGVPEPDTRAEQMVQEVVNSGAQAIGMLSGAGVVAAGAPALGAPSTAQGAAQMLGQNPQQQIQGALRAPIGAEVAGQAAQAFDAGPGWEAAARLAGGVGADMSASVLSVPGRRAVNNAATRMESAGITPQEARSAVRVAEDQGIALRRSDIFPPDNPLAWAMQGFRDAFGGAKLAAEQNRGRLRFAREVLEGYRLSPSRPQDLAPGLAEEFAKRRRTAFTTFGNMKQAALDTVPAGDIIPVNNTTSFIDDTIDELTALGGVNADPNIAASGGMSEADAAATNVYHGLISRLQDWRAAFQNKTIAQLELNRANFGDLFIPERGYADLRPVERQVVSGLYDSIRADIGEAVRRSGGDEAFSNWEAANKALTDLQRDLQREVIDNLVKPIQGQNNIAIANGNIPLIDLDRSVQQTVERLQQEPELIYNIFTHGTPSQIRSVLPYTSTETRRKALGAMLYEDMMAATPNVRNLSPSALADNLKDSFTRRELVMTPEDEDVLEGMALVFDISRRAEPASMRRAPSVTAGLPTPPGVMGMALRGMAASTGALVGTLAGGTLVGRNLAHMYESPQIRDQLIDLVEAGAASPRAEGIVQNILRMITPAAQRAPLMAAATMRAAARPQEVTAEQLTAQ